MIRLDRRRRRRRWAPIVAASLGVAVVLALLIGGLTRVGRSSVSYLRDVDRSYAAQAGVVVDQSNQLGTQFARVRTQMPGYQRAQLVQTLDSMANQASDIAANTETLSPPAPDRGLDASLTAVMNERAAAVEQARVAVEGLLSVTPAPLVQEAGTSSSGGASPAPSPSQATADLAKVGTTLAQSDQRYATLRRDFREVPGEPRLPRSVWNTNSALWSSATVTALTSELGSSSGLAEHHEVVLVAVRVNPPAVPSPSGSGSPVVPPTNKLSVVAIVGNQGNVDEHNVPVSALLQPQGAPGTETVRGTVSVAAGSYRSLLMPELRVTPGTTYTLTLSLTAPPGQGALGPSPAYAFEVAPATPTLPTTTTTTAPHHPSSPTTHSTPTSAPHAPTAPPPSVSTTAPHRSSGTTSTSARRRP